MKHLTALAASVCLAFPVLAQSADLKTELLAKERQARGDAGGLFQAAVWARDNGLAQDAQRILKKVLELDGRHEGANLALGNVLYLGHWMSRPDMYKEMGWVEVDGVWVEKDHRADARNGIFHNGDELVSREELAALQAGKVRHPVTGEFIEERDLGTAANSFPLGNGKWGTLEEANEYHSTMDHPWTVRSMYTTMVGTMPLADLQNAQGWVDVGYELVQKLFGVDPSPAHRPVVVIAYTSEQHAEFGNSYGAADSAHGAFVAEDVIEIAGIPGFVQPVFVNYGEEAWRPYHVRHGGGIAYVEAIKRDIRAPTMQEWFVRGLGAYAGRHATLSLSGYFGETDIRVSGGVRDNVKGWFDSFTIGGLERNDIDHNIFQAGLMIRFALAPENEGGDARVADAWADVVETIQERDGRGVARAVDRLQKTYYSKGEELRKYLQWLVQNKDR